jgi:hypothetical protein
MLRKIVGMFTGGLSLFSALVFGIGVVELLSGTAKLPAGEQVILLMFFGGVTALTGFNALKMLRHKPEPAQHLAAAVPAGMPIDIALEAQILRIAAAQDGKVTAAEVALQCGVSLDAATVALDALLARGHADLHVTPDGEAVHVLKGIMTAAEKAQSQNLLTMRDTR